MGKKLNEHILKKQKIYKLNNCKMNKYYITFWQDHAHSINWKTFDKNCVGVIKAENYNEARKIAFNLTNGVFAFSYSDLDKVWLEYYPRWLIEMN